MLAALPTDRNGAAAAEMALVLPLLLVILFGSVELGNFFYNEHILVKAVRDGARYAARQDWSYYSCSGAPSGSVVANTRALVRTSLLSGGTDRVAGIDDTEVTLSTSCASTAQDDASATENMSGIYKGRASGAPVVTVTASMPYTPIIGAAFGISSASFRLNASQQAAVMGL
ncbi:MAG TPA: TadE/TadG family type IV pilus assembly protein [Sphingomicrobium sp.]|nr:TadE/TadG family type IV pilus assembly protein [Sphingomicrobium sp.]